MVTIKDELTTSKNAQATYAIEFPSYRVGNMYTEKETWFDIIWHEMDKWVP